MDLSNSIIMPREDFYELQATATQPMSGKDRVMSAVHTTVVFTVFTAGTGAAIWSWAKATDWLEERRLQRAMRKRDHENHK